MISIPLIIGRDTSGWAVPLTAEIQSQKINEDDIGISIWSRPVNEDKLYVLLDRKEPGRITCVSRGFADEFFYPEFQFAHFKKLQIETFIPCLRKSLDAIASEKSFSARLDTLLVKPSDRKEAFEELGMHENPYLLYTIASKQLYFVSLTVHKVKNSIMDMTYIEIDGFSFIEAKSSKVQAILTLKAQLKEMIGIDFEFDPLNNKRLSFSDRQQKTITLSKKISLFNDLHAFT